MGCDLQFLRHGLSFVTVGCSFRPRIGWCSTLSTVHGLYWSVATKLHTGYKCSETIHAERLRGRWIFLSHTSFVLCQFRCWLPCSSVKKLAQFASIFSPALIFRIVVSFKSIRLSTIVLRRLKNMTSVRIHARLSYAPRVLNWLGCRVSCWGAKRTWPQLASTSWPALVFSIQSIDGSHCDKYLGDYLPSAKRRLRVVDRTGVVMAERGIDLIIIDCLAD